MHDATTLQSVDTDLLIIGGGTAGPMAAIKAKLRDPACDVLVVDKATVRRGGSICRGMDAYNNVVVPGVADVDSYVESIRAMSDGIFDEKVNRVLGERSFEVLRDLEEWGAATFPRDAAGGYIVEQLHPFGRFLAEMRGDIKPVMAKKCRELGVRTMDRTMATRLLTHEGRVTGAVLLGVRTGEVTVCRAKAVIMCTGSQGRFGLPETGYLFGTFDCPYNAGEGWSMIYEAGGDLVNFEFLDHTALIRDFEGPGHSTFTRHGAYLINALGERFLFRYHELGEHAPSGLRAKAMQAEIGLGHGPLYYDLRHLSDETKTIIKDGLFSCERPTEKAFFELKGIDIGLQPVELVLAGPHLCGGHGLTGALVDEWGRTTVPNLYAAGDVASTGLGFVGAAWVFGGLAAEHAVERMADIAAPVVDMADVHAEVARIRAPLGGNPVNPPQPQPPLHNDEGNDPREVEYKLRRHIKPLLDSPKHASRLRDLLGKMAGFRADIDRIRVADWHDVMKVLEIRSIADCMEFSARASLLREESRWGMPHTRLDFPERDPAWNGTYVVLRRGADGGMVVTRQPVRSA
ncbi:MAG TPA: fumarate reductase/succinate dehydrogenase flavoprotein subunit [Desulfovibrio sp.]|nr:fumarate reductase/succinate dehydrogenase flavoprotein subunit [Desulfovibrio sp.]